MLSFVFLSNNAKAKGDLCVIARHSDLKKTTRCRNTILFLAAEGNESSYLLENCHPFVKLFWLKDLTVDLSRSNLRAFLVLEKGIIFLLLRIAGYI
jgi:hypothetical protein